MKKNSVGGTKNTIFGFLMAVGLCLGMCMAPGAWAQSESVLSVVDTDILTGTNGVVNITMNAQGTENAWGFTIEWDPTLLTYVSSSIAGTDLPPGGTITRNTSGTASGKLGILTGLLLEPDEGLPPDTLIE